MKFKRKEIIILLLFLIIGFMLRYYTFDKKSLWIDEIYTYNDSRFGLKDQIKFYKENPTYLHPPLFFILTNLFYPFEKPERELRIIPLIFGTLSIPMLYFLGREFFSPIALPSAISLTFMTYHISLSQDGRSYSMLMFFGMSGLFFFLKHIGTLKKRYLIMASIIYSLLFYTSYSSIPFIIFSQIFWFYKNNENEVHNKLISSSFIFFNSLIAILLFPWIVFLGLNFKGQPMMDPYHTEDPGSFDSIIYSILDDWSPFMPLKIFSILFLILLPFLSKRKLNGIILISSLLLPIIEVYILCKIFKITHFISSKYFINLLPLFLIAIYLSIFQIENKLDYLKNFVRLHYIFTILFVFSNLLILPFYYNSQKQDFKGLATFLKSHLKPGDNIFDGDRILTPGILYYFGVNPEGRHYIVNFKKESGKIIEYKKSFIYNNQIYTIYWSNSCCIQYISDGKRLWIAVGKKTAKKIKEDSSFILKGYFNGSFLNWNRFPTDASIYLFLLDPNSPNEKGIDMPIE